MEISIGASSEQLRRVVREVQQETRARSFISLEEYRELLVSREILERAYDLPLEGREEELLQIRNFLSDSKLQVQLIHGPGGVGKSRLQYEAARKALENGFIEAVYCGTPLLERSHDWYIDVEFEKRALVLIDEPASTGFIAGLLNELHGRLRKWKLLITVRTPKDPVVAVLKNPRERLLAPAIELKPLRPADAAHFSRSLVASLSFSAEDRLRVERWLSNVCGRFPIWMTVATKMLETRADLRDLPTDSYGIAQTYLNDVLGHTREEVGTRLQVLTLLRWIALTQPINRHHEQSMNYLSEVSECPASPGVERMIEDLVRRRVLSAYGVEQRMVEIRPDVMRDHILIEWLTLPSADTRRPSQDSLQLARSLAREISSGKLSPFSERVTAMLGRMEYLVDPPIPFLKPLIDAAICLADTASDARGCEHAFSVARMFALWRPKEFVRIASTLRTCVHSTAGVLSLLPSELYRAAHGCSTAEERRMVLDELIACADMEACASPKLTTRSENASACLSKVIHERRGYRSLFWREAGTLALEFLDSMRQGRAPSPSWKAVITATTALERRDGFLDEERPNTYIFETHVLSLLSPEGKLAMDVVSRLWLLLLDRSQPEIADFSWKVLDTIHGDLIRNRGRAQRVQSEGSAWRGLLVKNLQHCRTIASDVERGIPELQAARKIWGWHLKHDKENAELWNLANECESAYLRHPLMECYAPIFGVDHMILSKIVEQEACAFAKSDLSLERLTQFFSGALQFTDSHAENWRSQNVRGFAYIVGEIISRRVAAEQFICESLQHGETHSLFSVALFMLAGVLHSLRGDGDAQAAGALLGRAFVFATTTDSKRAFVRSLFAHARPAEASRFGPVDLQFLKTNWIIVDLLPPPEVLHIVGLFLRLDPTLLSSVDMRKFDRQSLNRTVSELWDGYLDGLSRPALPGELSPDVIEELLAFSAVHGDFGQADGQLEHHVRQVFKTVPRKPLQWIVAIALKRIHHLRQADTGRQYERQFPTANSWLFLALEENRNAPFSEDDQKVLEDLLALAEDERINNDELAGFVAALDSKGDIVPDLIVTRLLLSGASVAVKMLTRWSRFAANYPRESAAWRKIALPVCEYTATLSPEDTDRIFYNLSAKPSRRWGIVLREQQEELRQALKEAEQLLALETVPALRTFWEWRVADMSGRIKHEQEQAEELDADG